MDERMEPKIQTIIAEDDDHAREYLQSLLMDRQDLELRESTNNCAGLRKAIINAATGGEPFELAVLDIDLRGQQVFDALTPIPPSRRPAIIFLSAHRHFAPEAFELRAVDYLMKPCDEAKLHRALDRAVKRIYNRRERRERLQSDHPGLLIPAGEAMRLVDFDSITYLESDNKRTIVHTNESTIVAHSALSQLAAKLPANRFIRIHRRYVVNLKRIQSLKHTGSGSYSLAVESHQPAELSVGATFSKSLLYLLGA